MITEEGHMQKAINLILKTAGVSGFLTVLMFVR